MTLCSHASIIIHYTFRFFKGFRKFYPFFQCRNFADFAPVVCLLCIKITLVSLHGTRAAFHYSFVALYFGTLFEIEQSEQRNCDADQDKRNSEQQFSFRPYGYQHYYSAYDHNNSLDQQHYAGFLNIHHNITSFLLHGILSPQQCQKPNAPFIPCRFY